MLKRATLLSLLLLLLLGACAPKPAVTETAAPPTQTEAAVATTETIAAPPTLAASKIPADCKPYNIIKQFFNKPRTDLPEITDKDWKIGPDDALVRIIVFSDFQ